MASFVERISKVLIIKIAKQPVEILAKPHTVL